MVSFNVVGLLKMRLKQGFSWGELGLKQSWRCHMWCINEKNAFCLRIKISDHFSPLTLVIVTLSDVIYWVSSVFNWCIKHGIYTGCLPVVSLWSGMHVCRLFFLPFHQPSFSPCLPPLLIEGVCTPRSFLCRRPWLFVFGGSSESQVKTLPVER